MGFYNRTPDPDDFGRSPWHKPKPEDPLPNPRPVKVTEVPQCEVSVCLRPAHRMSLLHASVLFWTCKDHWKLYR